MKLLGPKPTDADREPVLEIKTGPITLKSLPSTSYTVKDTNDDDSPGKIALKQRVLLSGVPIAPGREIYIWEETPEGRLLGQMHLYEARTFAIGADKALGSATCLPFEYTSLEQHGFLRECKLAADALIGGVTYSRYRDLTVGDGRIVRGTLATDQEVSKSKIPCKGREAIDYESDGSLDSCTLSKAHTLDGAKLAANTRVWFSGGRLSTARLIEDHKLFGKTCKATKDSPLDVSFDKGKISGCN